MWKTKQGKGNGKKTAGNHETENNREQIDKPN